MLDGDDYDGIGDRLLDGLLEGLLEVDDEHHRAKSMCLSLEWITKGRFLSERETDEDVWDDEWVCGGLV